MEEAGTLMDLVRPIGWGDLATKRDLEELRVGAKRDLDMLEGRFKDELGSKLRGLFFAIAGLFIGVVGLLLAVPYLV